MVVLGVFRGADSRRVEVGDRFRVGGVFVERAVAVDEFAVAVGIFFIEIDESDVVEEGVARGHIARRPVARAEGENDGYAAARRIVRVDISDEFLPLTARVDRFERRIGNAVDIDIGARTVFVEFLRFVAVSVEPGIIVGCVGVNVRLDPNAQLIDLVRRQSYACGRVLIRCGGFVIDGEDIVVFALFAGSYAAEVVPVTAFVRKVYDAGGEVARTVGRLILRGRRRGAFFARPARRSHRLRVPGSFVEVAVGDERRGIARVVCCGIVRIAGDERRGEGCYHHDNKDKKR